MVVHSFHLWSEVDLHMRNKGHPFCILFRKTNRFRYVQILQLFPS